MAAAGGDASVYVLSSELLPVPEAAVSATTGPPEPHQSHRPPTVAQVHCVCALDKDTVVTGGDDHLVVIWKRTTAESEAAGVSRGARRSRAFRVWPI